MKKIKTIANKDKCYQDKKKKKKKEEQLRVVRKGLSEKTAFDQKQERPAMQTGGRAEAKT